MDIFRISIVHKNQNIKSRVKFTKFLTIKYYYFYFTFFNKYTRTLVNTRLYRKKCFINY